MQAAGFTAHAQEPGQDTEQTAQPSTLDRTLTTLHGVVRNAATGEEVARALVRIEGDADTGALTDGNGHFEIPGVPVGPQQVDVTRPGFIDRMYSSAGADNGVQRFIVGMTGAGAGHNVMVAAEMPDVVFTLAPTGAIRGQIELSTGDTAEGMTIALAKRTIENGRAIWQEASTTKTHSDGSYRFGGLADGDYAVYSQPAMDSDLDETAGAGRRWGYASVYYPDARDPSGAARIHVADGGEEQGNLTLTLEPFQEVSATLVPQQSNSADRNLSAVVMDAAGHALPYHADYDLDSHSVKMALPDGSYTLLVQSMSPMERQGNAGGRTNTANLVGAVDFTVAGRAVPNFRVPLSAPQPSPVQLNVIHNATQPVQASEHGSQVTVLVSQAGGWIDDSMVSVFAAGPAVGPLETVYNRPGSYWVHTHIQQRGLCEDSFNAGGASLAREPVVFGLAGPAAPMELTLRDDCAQLQLSLPESLSGINAGEEPYFSVYVVPDFDSTADVESLVLRPSTGGTVTVNDLTPGNYRVYTFAGFVQLAYRNRDELPISGQAITLAPGATAKLVVEAPGQ
ncbi:MAG TPA: carboxypeptidase-like regulatory domain-containing protein [Terracidiphilus sp.]|nr:carboxypeptidase-like regulatory domain-containing protein [Terracidiphilus sp.]